jgi:hypothetical protein
MKRVKLVLISAVILFLPSILFAQTSKQDSIWRPFKYFVGKWNGSGVVEGANGKYERSYQFIFNKRFIEAKNKSIFSPTEKNPKGEVHEDLGYISYDKGRKTFILRQFHIEGFINQYKLDSISKDGKTIVFTSEAIENIPAGWRARETYQLINENEFIETFELAEPDKPFEVYSKATMKRQ